MKVIVADDSRVMRSIIEKTVRSLGHEVIHAANGQEVLDLLERADHEVNLVLLDWNMPVMNGIDVLSHMKSHNLGRDIAVLMISTESEDGRIEQAIRAGAKGYLSKPFTPEELATGIQSALEKSGSPAP
jgi:two-component system chemotaxis response regulator CheY